VENFWASKTGTSIPRRVDDTIHSTAEIMQSQALGKRKLPVKYFANKSHMVFPVLEFGLLW
jgi:hypothetical protein